MVQSSVAGLFALSLEQRPDRSISVSRPTSIQNADHAQQLYILQLLMQPSRAAPFVTTRAKLRARDAERSGAVFTAKPRRAVTASGRAIFLGNLYGLPENLVLQRLLTEHSLEFPDGLRESVNAGGLNGVLIDPDRFLPALDHTPRPVKQPEGTTTILPS
jgi:hypothetical protein